MNNSIFNTTDNQLMIDRINKLTPTTPAVWGKMNTTQMLKHTNAAAEIAFGEKTVKVNFLMKLLGKMLKNKIFNSEFKRNSPTAPELIFKDNYDFDASKKELITNFSKFAEGEKVIKVTNHPFWGKMTPDHWNKLMWRHLDHHLIQFGV
jgi:hypothetical protein